VWTILSFSGFADKFGFTQDELDKILDVFALPDLAAPMQEWYNGYSFGGHTIYNPWSVINCVNRHPNPIGPQWLNTSDNTLIHEELAAGGLELQADLLKLMAGEELRYPISEHTIFADIGKTRKNIWSFLCLSGYLRAEDPVHDPDLEELTYRLSIPNAEVRGVYRDFVERHYHEDLHATDITELLQALKNDDIVDFERRLQDLVLGILSFYDVTKKHPEAVYHTFMLGILANLRGGYRLVSNVESGYGRADILMLPKREGLTGKIIELKSLHSDEDIDKAHVSAFDQIADKKYETQLRETGVTNIVRIVIAVQGKNVQVRKRQS